MFTGSGSPEPIIAILAVALAVACAWLQAPWLGWWEKPLSKIGRRRALAVVFAAAAPLLLRVLLLPWHPMREPRLHDEHSFLLGADTLLHGRLGNPAHRFWMHFESMHILVRPSYASVFPIAQSAALAAGVVLFGHPEAGVWLGCALMCGAICWMLQGWLPPRWALLGAILVVLRIGVSSYWMNSYWGGCVAAAGGALVLGALPRIVRGRDWRNAVVMGIGLAILANSRPVEGAVFGLAAGGALLSWVWRGERWPWRRIAGRVLAPLAIVLAITGAGMAYYFARITGKPLVAPYVLYRSMTMAPHFVWQKPGPQPLYNNTTLRGFYAGWEMYQYNSARSAPWSDVAEKARAYWRFYLGVLLTIPFVAALALRRNSKVRRLLWIGAIFSLALCGQVWHNVHYAAPATGLAFLMVVYGMRSLRLWRWRNRPVGLYLVWALPWGCAAMLAAQIVAGPSVDTASSYDSDAGPSWRWPSAGGVKRARILKELETAGKHLVMVRYALRHDVGDEWVYNGADIDGSRVVWARELDPGSNRRLIEYFHDRHVWLVEPDLESPRLTPYSDVPPRDMAFVQVGAPGIESLRSVPGLRDRIQEIAKDRGYVQLNCDQWNRLFTDATGVEGPDATHGCDSGGDRRQVVEFERWFAWLLQQR